jgi:hypothetical protein
LVAAGSRTFQISDFKFQISAFLLSAFCFLSRAGCPADQSGRMPELRTPLRPSTFDLRLRPSTFDFRLSTSTFDLRLSTFLLAALSCRQRREPGALQRLTSDF